MARLRGHQPLDVSREVYVKRSSLTLAGRSFAAGDVLPWRELGVSPRKLHQLWAVRMVGHEQIAERNGAENPAALVRLPAAEPVEPEPPRGPKRKR